MRKRFLPILGRSVRADLIGRQFWANPADFAIILVKIDDFPVSVWWMGATLHVRAKIFADHWSTCRQRRHRDRRASRFLEKSMDFPVSVRSGPLGSIYETGSDRSTNRTKNRQKSPSIRFRTVDCKGRKCASRSVLYFYAISWINLIDFVGSPS